jgi:hypothetical protein
MNGDAFRELLKLANRLQAANIHYEIRQVRENAIMLDVHVPGERWEIEFVDYEDEVQMEIERFRSDGQIGDDAQLDELWLFASDSG